MPIVIGELHSSLIGEAPAGFDDQAAGSDQAAARETAERLARSLRLRSQVRSEAALWR